MENLNNIPKVGTIGGMVDGININFTLIKEMLERLELTKDKSVGLFSTLASLQATYPSPKVGDWALVGTSSPFAIYECTTAGTWEATGGTYSGEIDLANYATKSDVSEIESYLCESEILSNQGTQSKNVYCGSDTSIGSVGEIVDSTNTNAYAATIQLDSTVKTIVFTAHKWNGDYGYAFFNSNNQVLTYGIYKSILTESNESLTIEVPTGAAYVNLSLYLSYRDVVLRNAPSNLANAVSQNTAAIQESVQIVNGVSSAVGNYTPTQITEALTEQGTQYRNVYCGDDTSVAAKGSIVTSTSGNAFAAVLQLTDIVQLSFNFHKWSGDYGIAFFNSSDELISAIIYKDEVSSDTVKVVNVPTNAAYANVSLYAGYRDITLLSQSSLSGDVSTLKTKVSNMETDVQGMKNPYVFVGSPTAYRSALTTTGLALFTSVSEVFEAWDALVTAHQDWLKRETDIGTDASGTYAIRYYTLRWQNPNVNAERDLSASNEWSDATFKPRRVLLNLGVHPLEPASLYGGYLAVKAIIESTENWANFIKDNLIIDIVPLANPWGLANSSNNNANGVNLNRDYASDSPQAETTAMKTLITNLVSKNLVGIVDCHNCNYAGGGYLVAKSTYTHYKMYAKLAQQIQALMSDDFNEVFGEATNHFHLWKADGNNGQLHQYANEIGVFGCTFEISNSSDVVRAILTKSIAINLIQAFGYHFVSAEPISQSGTPQGNHTHTASQITDFSTAATAAVESDFEKKLPITSSSSTSGTMSANAGVYYKMSDAIGTMEFSLVKPSDTTKTSMTMLSFTTAESCAVTFSATDSVPIYYQDGFAIEASSIYEISALYNGSVWMLTAIKIVTSL